MKAAIALHLFFQGLENLADELGDLAAAQAGHVDVVAAQLAFIVVAFAVEVHEVQFVDHALALQQMESAVDGAAVDGRINCFRFAQYLAGVQVLAGSFNHGKNGAACNLIANILRRYFNRRVDSGMGENVK
jgi:hypothetical protein